jgi:cell shape-determining protein MreC
MEYIKELEQKIQQLEQDNEELKDLVQSFREIVIKILGYKEG